MDKLNSQAHRMDNSNLIIPVEDAIPSLMSSDHLNCLPRLESGYLNGSVTNNNNNKHLCESEVMESNVLVVLPSSTESNLLLQNEQVLCEKAIGCNSVETRLEPDVKHQVFSEVMATISDYCCQLIAENQLSLLEKLQLDANVRCEDKENSGVCVIRGNLQQILQAQQLLETYIEESRNCTGEILPSLWGLHRNAIRRKTSDKSVMCDIIKLGRLSHFAMEHPRQARFSSLVLRQASSRLGVKEAIRLHRKTIKRKKVLSHSYSEKRIGSITNNHKAQVENIELPICDRMTTSISESVGNEQSSNDFNQLDASKHAYTAPSVATGGNIVSGDLAADVQDAVPSNFSLDPKSIIEEKNSGADFHPDEDDEGDDDEEEDVEEEIRKKTRRNYEELTPFKFFCKRCSFKTKRESHYAKHLGIHDKVKTLYNCENCSFTTIRLSHLRRHEMSHSQTTYNCDQCTYKTDEMKLLSRHVKLKHKRDEDPPSPAEILQCSHCPYKTTKPYHFKRHLRVHSSEVKSSSRVYQCDQCTYKTNRKEHYIRHVNNVHSNKRPYLCDFCGKAFKRPDALKQHRITHGGLDSRTIQFKCSVCQKKCRSQAHLNEHQAVHSNIRMFLCEICGASFKTRSVQRKHIVTIHKNPRAHPCEHCDKRFNTNYALRRHLRLHLAGDDNLLVSLTNDASAIALLDDSASPSHDQLLRTDTSFSEQLVANPPNTLSLTFRPNLPTADQIPSVSDGTTLVTVQESFDQITNSIPQGAPSFIQTSEATTALLYLTANFTQF